MVLSAKNRPSSHVSCSSCVGFLDSGDLQILVSARQFLLTWIQDPDALVMGDWTNILSLP